MSHKRIYRNVEIKIDKIMIRWRVYCILSSSIFNFIKEKKKFKAKDFVEI